MMKRRLLCLLLCVVMVASLAVPGTLATGSDTTGSITVTQNGEKVTAVAVPQNGTATLTASDAGSHQWQIQAGDTWVDIQGQTTASIDLRYAMVANLMQGGQATVRCVADNFASDAIAVTVTEPLAYAANETVERPVAVSGPEVIDHAQSALQAELEALESQIALLTEETIPALEAAYASAQAETAQAQAALEDARASSVQAESPAGEETEAAVPDETADDSAAEEPAPSEPDFTELEAALAAAKAAEEAAKTALDNAKADADALIAQYSSMSVMTLEETEGHSTFTVVINYQFADGTQAASPYTATVAAGSALNVTVNSPAVLGYTPDQASITINENINADKTHTVTYQPAEVNFTVLHYQQNVNDDHYTLVEREVKTGYTESAVGENLGKNYEGFYSLLYDTTTRIAADGSTVVEIYYDRYYYLMNFDLDGGYGVEPIYARYGAQIEWKTPVKQGYTFAGWTPSAQGVDTMPAENRTYKASWTLHNTVPVTVIFWGENPNDEGYSYDHSGSVQAEPGKNFTFSESLQFIICGQESHTHTDDCTYACGKTEHTHTAEECHYACGEIEHIHDASCLTCSHTTHDLSCYEVEQGAFTARELKEVSRPDQELTDKGNGIYTYQTGSYIKSTHYYLNLNGKWYAAHWGNGSLNDEKSITLNCSHTHTASCYKDAEHRHSDSCGYACGEGAHAHSYADCGSSCGKTEHTHINSCYQNGAGMDSNLWTFKESETVTVAPDGSSIINVYYDRTEFTLHFREADSVSDDYGTITDKWGAAIGDRWTQISDTADCTNWSESRGGGAPWTGYWDTMPAEDRIYYKASNGTYIARYYVEDLNGNYVERFVIDGKGSGISIEDFFEMEGFTYDHGTDGDGDSIPKPSPNISSYGSFGGAKFYYTRNSYNLEYMSSGSKLEDKTASVKYEAPLSPYDITPPYPSNLEPNAFYFGGWYDDQYFQQPTNWESTMPASDKVVYAKWTPTTHKVNFYLTKDTVGGTKLIDEQIISHGEKVSNVPTEINNGSYTFIGWFYDDNGTEKAFDPNNMPVNRDLDLYGKWSANTLVEYTIKYAVENADGTLTYIAEDTTGTALALTTKTFEAKTGDELYEGYQSGYFPKEASHSITMSADEGATNEWTFIYVQKEKVPYTVRYLEEGTNAVLHEEKTVETPDAIVTETFVPVTGYMPDAYQKRLVLSVDETLNVITFWYVKDDTHAPLHIVHYTQNIDGEDYTLYQESTDTKALIGNEYRENPLTIPGFEYKAEKSTASGTMTAAGLELTLYYDRIEYPYEFKFLEQGTNKVLAESVTGTARYQAQVTQNFKGIVGYHLVSASPQVIQIAIEDPADVANKNVRIFYYQENEVTLNYEVVGPEDCGTVTPSSETVKAVTGTALGSTATPSSNLYKFVGWYLDEACTQPVLAENVDANNKFVPTKAANVLWANGTTYYAKFEYNLTTMTIAKSGTAYESGDVFIFDIYHGNTLVTSITLGMGKQVTISGLTVGETYTVHERTTGTRYTGQTNQTCTLKPNASENTITFTNSVKTNIWLSAVAIVKNIFTKND